MPENENVSATMDLGQSAEIVLLRQKVEALLKTRPLKKTNKLFVSEVEKLNHELEEKQTELQLQNFHLQVALSAKESPVGLDEVILMAIPYPAMYIRRKDRVVLAVNKLAADLGVKVGGHCWRDFRKTNFINEQDCEISAKYPEIVPEEFKIKCSFCLAEDCYTGDSEQNHTHLHAFGRIWDTYWEKVNDEAFLHYVVNVTEKNIAEQALKESEEKYRLLAENISDVIWVYNLAQSKFTYVSPSILQLSGFTVEEVMKHGLFDLLTDESAQRVTADLPLGIADFQNGIRQTYVYEVQRKCKDGSLKWLEISARCQYAKDKTIEFLGVSRDISARKQAAGALLKSEEKYRTLIENMGEGVAFLNVEDEFIFANPSAEKIFGVDKGSLVGSYLFDYLSDENIEIVKNETFKRSQGQSSVYEYRINLKDGGERDILVTATPCLEEGKFVGAFAIFRDFTEHKRVEDDLRKSEENLLRINAEKDRFFSIIAHDLKSPFNGFLGLTEIMANGLQRMKIDDIKKLALVMRASANNLFRLLANLLEWSRMQRGLTTCSPVQLLLMPKISQSVVLASDQANKKEITIIYDVPADLSVFADDNMIEGIVRNLVTNAVKFTNKGGIVVVSAKPFSEHLAEISVTDTGIGMNQEMISHLFRLDINTNRKGTDCETGTGLGLIICKDLIEKSGGKLWVESEEGKGSTFRFTLPLHAAGDALFAS